MGARRSRKGKSIFFRKQEVLSRNLALSEIQRLLNLARKVRHENLELSREYVLLTKKIAMRQRLKIPPHLKKLYCKSCYTPYTSDADVKVRIDYKKRHIRYFCRHCKHIRRIPYVKRHIRKESTRK